MIHPQVPVNNQVATAPATAPNSEDEEILAMAINASLESAAHEGLPHAHAYIGSGVDAPSSSTNSMNSSSHDKSSITGSASSSHEGIGSKCEIKQADSTGISSQGSQNYNAVPSIVQTTLETPSHVSIPSAPPLADVPVDDGPILYPSIDTSPIDLSSHTADEKKGDDATGSCTICLDAPLEGACIPCGHLAGCMSCLNEIKGKKWGCPVCRAKIDQVIRIYAV